MSTSSAQADGTAVFDLIRRVRIVPVIRMREATAALSLVERLLDAGLDVLEITTSIEGWDEVIRDTRKMSADACVGAGTVTTRALAERAVAAGAEFCVSPGLAPQVRATLEPAGVPLLEGGLTPTEVFAAAEHGVAKLFPAHVGGIPYLRSLLAVAPEARIMPTGGIPLPEAGTWLAADAFAVGIGSDLAAPGDIAARVREALKS
jgi:2-dehydro-3-deoxyphosphogluconate aldolase/(4S)-4-hydroxy-2-oxoglutarate aldolase